MNSIHALQWLGIDQWLLRVARPDLSLQRSASFNAVESAPDFAEQEQSAEQAGLPGVTEAPPTTPEQGAVEDVSIRDLCFVAADSDEYAALISAISRCLPAGKTLVHRPATQGQRSSVQWAGQTWSLDELRQNGQAKRALWRLLVGSTV